MSKLLHIQSSPRHHRSASIAVAQHFIETYKARFPDDTVETLDLWEQPLPEFNNDTLDAKYAIMHGHPHSEGQAEAWKAVADLATHFKSADKYLISLPMWNFSIPYKLKHYLDLLIQPGLTVDVSAAGYKGLVTGKPTVVVYARGGAYGPGTGAEAYDFQSPYLRHALGFIGMTDLKEIFVEPTAMSPDSVSNGKFKAEEIVRSL